MYAKIVEKFLRLVPKTKEVKMCFVVGNANINGGQGEPIQLRKKGYIKSVQYVESDFMYIHQKSIKKLVPENAKWIWNDNRESIREKIVIFGQVDLNSKEGKIGINKGN